MLLGATLFGQTTVSAAHAFPLTPSQVAETIRGLHQLLAAGLGLMVGRHPLPRVIALTTPERPPGGRLGAGRVPAALRTGGGGGSPMGAAPALIEARLREHPELADRELGCSHPTVAVVWAEIGGDCSN